MKIVAGMSRIEDYEAFARAGADEVFIGYIPPEWQIRYGLYTPLNRREVCNYHVQIGAESDLGILAEMIRDYHIPATVAFNGLNFRPEQYDALVQVMLRCRDLGFSSVITADPALLVYLKDKGITDRFSIHISGEFGEMNRYAVRELAEQGAKRLIFHRKVPVSDMRTIIEDDNGIEEFEAFILNELCHFHGGYCSSLHCDELIPMCRMPYIITGGEIPEIPGSQSDLNSLGAGGCGLCALWGLREAGITHLKIVGRGAHSENMIRDIRALRRALEILSSTTDENLYIHKMKEELFPFGCTNRCYYTEEKK